MGLMELPRAEPGQLIVTPHPMLLDGQRNVVWEARAGESLYAILQRNVPELDGQRWDVCIGGAPVERHLWHRVSPKQGQVIEVRGGVGKSALAIVALIALTYFTFGIAGAGGAVAGMLGGGFAGAALATGAFMAGSMLINKVLGPKPARASSQQQDSVYSISGARNQLRPYEPIPLLFGRVRITPDLLSKPYTWYEGNDQYLGMLLCSGINVGRIGDLYNGDTKLADFDGVQVTHAGYTEMSDQAIPLFSNVDTIDGAELPKNQSWVQRTTSADTVRIQINLEYVLGGTGTSGKSYFVNETVEAQYRPVGATAWQPLASQTFRSDRFDVRRATLARDVARGQYDVRVRMLGQGNYTGKNTQKNDFQWTQLTSVQADDADYTGIARSGVRIKATGQLNGSPDELRGIAYSKPIPEWSGTAWVTKESSNPGAQILAYARGISEGGRLLGGMALADAQIDIESLKAFGLHCAANDYTYDYYIKDARSHNDVLSSIARAGFGEITWAGGRLGVVWAAQEQPLSGVVNMATIKKGQFQVDYTLVNAADGIEYSYFDAATWETKTLRVPAPGVTTMLNPAQVSGEGVTTEVHAARLARWHLAQSLYQYKDIGYSTDIEHLSYQRLSLLALQHDMTQWGYGGRVQAAVNAAGTVTLTLDEPVPAPTIGNAYIGLRIPGERVYRVLRVRPFAGESRTVELAEAWPTDAALPGGAAANPAHDTLWIYDFKQTPGLRVRVTSIEPESDLKGASVRVVAEGPEFWNYVLTGAYIPPPSGSLLPTKPVASNLRITEQQVVQGNTTFTELTATFDVTGPVGNIVVSAAGAAGGGILSEVAQTRTRTATWRIPRADSYTVVVRPFAEDGTAGVAATGTYITAGADVPPVLVDLFDVQERSGGVRLYTWGWLADTMQSPDFAGVEIRYAAGVVSAPDWDAMTPVGDSGFFTAAFEAVMPDAGEWTFACRSRNSSGVLSAGMRIVTKTLGANLGQTLDQITQEQIAQQEAIDAALQEAAEANLRSADALLLMGTEYDDETEYAEGDVVYLSGRMYRALQNVPLETPPPAPAYWADVGTVTEAQGETMSAVQQMRVDVNENGQEIAALTQRVGSSEVSVSELMEVQDSASVLPLRNTGFEQTPGAGNAPLLPGWSNNRPDTVSAPTKLRDGVYSIATSPHTGGYCLRFGHNADNSGIGAPGFAEHLAFYNDRVLPVTVGERIRMSFWTRVTQGPSTGVTIRPYLHWIDETGNRFDYTVGGIQSIPIANHGWRNNVMPAVEVPAGAVGVCMDIRTAGGTLPVANCYLYFDDIRLERISETEGQLMARHTVALDVNGLVSGTISENDGERSSFSILATVFRVISNLTGMGMEWQDGYLRIWKNAAQLILGHTFGSGDLVMWYGPNVGASNCTKANATFWLDTSGGAYFGGSLSAGVLKNAVQSTSTATSNLELINGPFATNGRVRNVVISYSRTHRRVKNAHGSDGFVAGAGANTAKVLVYRKIGDAAEALWQTVNVTGTVDIRNEPDSPDIALSLWGGSVTVNDTSPAANPVQYRAVLSSFTAQAVTHQSGNFDSQTISQNLAIVSVED